jgi:hypothetical protein
MICICGHLKSSDEVLWAFLCNCIYTQATLEFLAKFDNHHALKNVCNLMRSPLSTFEPPHKFSQNLICTFFAFKVTVSSHPLTCHIHPHSIIRKCKGYKCQILVHLRNII